MRRKTRSTSEAFAILERWREYKLQCGRVLAVRIAQVRGTVHVGLVREALVAEGIVADVPVDEINGPSERWIGPLFIDRKVWEKTGERVPRANRGRNVHGGDTVNVWRLIPGADVSAYLTMPDPPVAAIAEAPEPAAEAGNVVRFNLRVAAEELRAACVGPLGPDATAALVWMLGETATA